MGKLLSLLLKAEGAKLLVTALSGQVKSGVAPLAPYLRKLSFGLLLIIVSSLGWIAGLVFLLVSLFLTLAGADSYVMPALYTAFTGFGLGIILLLSGLRLLRKPR